ncbi:MAG: AI-2E family transporter [Bacteroidota bacterium]
MTTRENKTRSISKSLFLLVFIIFIGYLSYLFRDLIFLVIISLLIAFIFNPVVTFLENRGMKRFLAVILVFAFIGVLVVFGISVMIPKIANQFNLLANLITKENINKLILQIQEGVDDYLPFIDASEFALTIEEFVSKFFLTSVNNFTEILGGIVSALAIMIIVPFITFFLLKDNKQIVKGIVNITPNKYFEFSFTIIDKTSKQLGKYVRGWILDAFIVGFASAIGLWILGIQNSATIGLIAGVGHLIPYFGPLIGGLPAVLISLVQFGDLSKLPEILIMFTIIYSFDNGYIQPNIFSKQTDFHPLMIILLILMGGQLLGMLGMLLAVPIATVMKTAAKEIYYGYKNYKIIKI